MEKDKLRLQFEGLKAYQRKTFLIRNGLPRGLGEDSKWVCTCIFQVGGTDFCNHILLDDALIKCVDSVHFNLGL